MFFDRLLDFGFCFKASYVEIPCKCWFCTVMLFNRLLDFVFCFKTSYVFFFKFHEILMSGSLENS